ncbi:MAG: thiamine pyrophosphate-dependent enzyme [Pseudomonadota bacterium]
MNSFLNTKRPPVFCPGCTHEIITRGLDKALGMMGALPEKTVIVSDIGCSGLFDTFFNVHALHGLHGRALTYASGLKLANPDLTVIVTMGDGGLGIGGAHVLAACRKNLDLTLIILNNFNFGMTGGQFSFTTPSEAQVGSEFLNRAEIPMDICSIAESAGATWINRCSGLDVRLPEIIVDAIRHPGFSVVETLGMCTGRYTKRNALNPRAIDAMVQAMPPFLGRIEKNARPEYGETYRRLANEQKKQMAADLAPQAPALAETSMGKRQEIVILGSAGMRIVTAGDIVCYAGIAAGMKASMKNDYNITVLRGQSVSEIILSPEPIGYAGIESPTIVLALSDEGVQRRIKLFGKLEPETFVLKEKSVAIPETRANVFEIYFKAHGLKRQDWALASLGVVAARNLGLTLAMLDNALKTRFKESMYTSSMAILNTIAGSMS